MSTYVLIAGAWLGGWAWQNVTRRLRQHGHTVYPLTLTGLAERKHLGGPTIDLETHIADVINLFEYEDLEEVTLVGHSYAGSVVAAVADRRPERLAALVYCDSGPLPNGTSLLDLNSPAGQEQLRAEVQDGWRLPFPGFPGLGEGSSIRGLSDEDQALMQRKATDHPFASWTQPLHVERQGNKTPYQQVVIACDDAKQFLPMIQPLIADARIVELDTGHWPMLSKPSELAELLENVR